MQANVHELLPEVLAAPLEHAVVTRVIEVTAFTVKFADAPVVLSVIASTQAVEPHVKVAAALMFEATVGEPMLSPVQVPLTVERVKVGADTDQIELVPVKLIAP